jgi:Protein of unknown function (DUF3606)
MWDFSSRLDCLVCAHLRAPDTKSMRDAFVLYSSQEGYMTKDRSTAGQTDVDRVNIHEPDDIRNWAKRLEIDEDQLKETVKAVGTSVNAIKKALAGKPVRKP